MYTLKTEAHFDSAHFLADYFGKCENLHGHRFKVVVSISSSTLQDSGSMKDMVLDFGLFKREVSEVVAEYDHTFLYEDGTLKSETVRCLEDEGFSLTPLPFRPTAENLARSIADKLIDRGLPICEVEVYETPLNCAIYRVEEN